MVQCRVVDKKINQSMSVEEMRMLRWISGVTREDWIRNEYVIGSIGIAVIVDKKRENKLRLFEHVMRRENLEAVRQLWK